MVNKDYLMIDNNTGNILYVMNWGRDGTPSNFNPPTGNRLELLDEALSEEFNAKAKLGIKFKLTDINGLSFSEVFEELPPVAASVIPTYDERLALIEEAMNDILLGGV